MIQAKIRATALVLLVALAVCSPLRAQLLLTYGQAHIDPTVSGSYVRWSTIGTNADIGRIGYQYIPQITVGQQWEYDHGVDSKGYDLYRGFAVFNFPRFTGVLPLDGVIIQDPFGLYPEVTQFLARVTHVGSPFEPVSFPSQHGPLPVEVRWTTLLADKFADGSIDPATAYNSLINGHLIEGEGYAAAQSLIDFLHHFDGGPIVFSFTTPYFVDEHTFSALTTYDGPGIPLLINYGIYRAFSPVPEPSTYALAGLSVCLAAVGIRSRRLRTARGNQRVGMAEEAMAPLRSG